MVHLPLLYSWETHLESDAKKIFVSPEIPTIHSSFFGKNYIVYCLPGMH
jgi:hypothetical protein